MMRDKSIIAQERLKGSILSLHMKLERQMGHYACLHCCSSPKEVGHYLRPNEGCSSRPPLSHPEIPAPFPSPRKSLGLLQWNDSAAACVDSLVTVVLPSLKIHRTTCDLNDTRRQKKGEYWVLVLSLKPCANKRYSSLYFWVPTTSFWWVIITFLAAT